MDKPHSKSAAEERRTSLRRGFKTQECRFVFNGDPAVSNRLRRGLRDSRGAPHRGEPRHRPRCAWARRRARTRPRASRRAIQPGYRRYLRGARVLSQQSRGDAAGREAPRASRHRSESAVVTHATRSLIDGVSAHPRRERRT